MKKLFVSIVLIFTLIFSVFGNNKAAHMELREEFENFSQLPELIERGFDLDKLDEIDNKQEMLDYLQQFFIDENGMPLDNHSHISFSYDKGSYKKYDVKTQSSMHIEWSDEYGSKDELLEKGYIENENMFYYPLYNGEWREDGYRVGKKYMGDIDVSHNFYKNYSVTSKNALLVGLKDFKIKNNKNKNTEFYKEISKSKKKYLILDLSYNDGGRDISYLSLIDAINKMKPKEIFIMVGGATASMGECATSWIEKATNIKTTIVGLPTIGAWKCAKNSTKEIKFDDFSIRCKRNDNPSNWKWGWDMYNIPYPTEGIGVTPNIYATPAESLEVIKHLINDNELNYPEDYL